MSDNNLLDSPETDKSLSTEKDEVDPNEEKLKSEFSGVKRSFIPMQAIIRIDEVEKSGVCKISNGDNIAPFPVSLVGAKSDSKDS
mgnify:CR=1 FL=1